MKKSLNAIMACALAGAALAGGAAQAQGWTATQPVRIVVPFSAGGGSDVAARLLAQNLGNSLGQPVVVENKPGASGAIASDIVYSAAPDGHTMLLGTADTQGMTPHVNKVRYDSMKYVPVAGIAKVSYMLVGRPGLKAADLKALVEQSKTTSFSYGTSGTGAAAHVQTSMFLNAAKITNMLHVPFQGVAPAFQAMLADQVDLTMVPVALAAQYRGKIRFYGIASLHRADALPDVPTLAEQGYPVDGDPWVGLLAPPGTPEAAANAISEKVRAVLAQPDVQKKLRELGMTPYLDSRAEFISFYKKDYPKWGEAIRAAGVVEAK